MKQKITGDDSETRQLSSEGQQHKMVWRKGAGPGRRTVHLSYFLESFLEVETVNPGSKTPKTCL